MQKSRITVWLAEFFDNISILVYDYSSYTTVLYHMVLSIQVYDYSSYTTVLYHMVIW